MSCSAPADCDLYQTALLVRVTPASENWKPVTAPPSPPLKPRLMALIWPVICESVTAPAAPSVTTCQYTGTVTEKSLGARPLADRGRSRAVWAASLSRTRPWALPRASAPRPAAAAAISAGEHAQAGKPAPANEALAGATSERDRAADATSASERRTTVIRWSSNKGGVTGTTIRASAAGRSVAAGWS